MKMNLPKKKKGDRRATGQSSEKQAAATPSDDTTSAAGEEGKPKSEEKAATPPTPNIPALLPLLHSETQKSCLLLTLQLLGLKSKKGVIDKVHIERMCPPPNVLNGESCTDAYTMLLCSGSGLTFCFFLNSCVGAHAKITAQS